VRAAGATYQALTVEDIREFHGVASIVLEADASGNAEARHVVGDVGELVGVDGALGKLGKARGTLRSGENPRYEKGTQIKMEGERALHFWWST